MSTENETPNNLIDKALDREGHDCPQCRRPNALTSRNVVGDDDFVSGQVWCPKCDYSINVVIDGDGQVWDYDEPPPGRFPK